LGYSNKAGFKHIKSKNMKKSAIIMASIILLAISYSCSDDFFDRQPLGTSSETVFYNAQGVDALLTGVYGVVGGGFLWTGSWGASATNWTYGSVASDDAYKGSDIGDQTPVNAIERWDVLTTNQYPDEKWRWVFMGVTRANEVLRILELAEGIDTGLASQMEAEARFLRAWYNFEGWLVFRNIPIITEETEDPTSVPNTENILPHIISDLTFAAENLPETPRNGQPGRATRYSAMALAARAHLQELDYQAAKPLLDAIIASGRFQLVPNFFDNYRIASNNNAESIFEIQRSVNDGAPESFNGEIGIGLNYPHGADIGMCCGFHQPSQNLVNAFRVDANGLPAFDMVNVHLKNDQGVPSSAEFIPFDDLVDPRLDWTVSRRGIPYLDWGINRGRDWIRNQPDGGPYMPASKFFFYQSERFELSTQTGWQTGVNANNYRALRYGHVLLWRAEVAVSEGDFGYAEELVNMIRERAANEVVMGRVNIFQLPPAVYPWGSGTTAADYRSGGAVDWSQPAANYLVQPYPAGTFAANGAEYAMRAVQWELRLEFATEGHRFFDLRRWGIINETLNAFKEGDLQIREFLDGAVFTDRDRYQPIPQSQLDQQPGVLQQNPGY
jgi:starch-binding outer membrane protein, SusD/RagB family